MYQFQTIIAMAPKTCSVTSVHVSERVHISNIGFESPDIDPIGN